jgi:hypothetical protein
MPEKRTCGECGAWTPGEKGYGHCKRMPPCVKVLCGCSISYWPETNYREWCWESVPKDGDEKDGVDA